MCLCVCIPVTPVSHYFRRETSCPCDLRQDHTQTHTSSCLLSAHPPRLCLGGGCKAYQGTVQYSGSISTKHRLSDQGQHHTFTNTHKLRLYASSGQTLVFIHIYTPVEINCTTHPSIYCDLLPHHQASITHTHPPTHSPSLPPTRHRIPPRPSHLESSGWCGVGFLVVGCF